MTARGETAAELSPSVLQPAEMPEGLAAGGRMPEPCALVIFGATGDLTQRKLIPALYSLACDGLLPDGFTVIGCGRTALSNAAFHEEMKTAVAEFSRQRPNDELWHSFSSRLRYVQYEMGVANGLDNLKQVLQSPEIRQRTGDNRIYYFAIPPSGVPALTDALGEAGLSQSEGEGYRRLIVEKPFGRNLETARQLNEVLHRSFSESQIFRIDHYLGKETVQNIMVFRFANGIFEPLWNRQYIDHVQITVAETIGIENRGSYYEESGALRDIIQNHVMQLAAIIGMEPPSNFDAETVRDEKVKLLRAVRPIHPDDALSHTVRGQYAAGVVDGESVVGYRQEPGVSPESLRETFVAMKLDIDNWRWAGTPFYLRTGKRLPKRATEIAIQFRRVPHSPFGGHQLLPAGVIPDDAIDPNRLLLRIQPDEGITLQFSAKVPGQSMRIRNVNMDFMYGSAFQKQSPEAYERLLLDCMLGDATLFAREDEVEQAWRFCTAILDGWRAHPPDRVNCPNYASGSWGPQEAARFIERDGRRWRHL